MLRIPRSLLLAATAALSLPACIRAPEAESDQPKADARAPKDAAELLSRYAEAMGGEALLRSQPQRTVEARVVFKAHDDCQAGDPGCIAEERVGQFVLYATADGRLYRRMLVGDRVDERGFDGETGWNLIDGQHLEIESPESSLASREDALLHWYFDIESREITPELIEGARAKGHDGSERVMDGLRWQAAHGLLPERSLWFDRETGLLREEVEHISDDHLVVIIYDGYREVDGALVAHDIRQLEIHGESQKEIDILVQSVHHKDLREGLFDIPELPPLEPEADPYLGALADAKAAADASPKELSAQMDWARVAFAVAHFDEAETAAKRALKIDAREPEAMWIAARVALLRGDLKDASRMLDKARKYGLRPTEWARHTAWIASHQRKWETTAELLREAGYGDLAGPYDAVVGDPLKASFAGRSCSTELSMARSKLVGAPVVEATVDGKTVRLMLDTGTRDLILAEPVAREVLITRESDSPIGATGGPPLPHGVVETLQLGELSLSNVTAAIVPAQALEASAGGVDGVLGVRPLLDFQLVLDAEAETLTLVDGGRRCAKERKKAQRGSSMPMYVHETHFVYMLAGINGAEGLFLLNTGMRGADVAASSGAYRRAGIRPPAIVGGEMGLAKVRSFELGPEREIGGLQAAYGVFEGEASSDNFRLDGMISLSALGPGPIVLDFPDRRAWFPTPVATPKPAPTKTESPKPESPKPEKTEPAAKPGDASE